MIKGIEHIAILAYDTAKLSEWYVKMFGFRVVLDNGKGSYFLMAPDRAMIEIVKAEENGTLAGLKTSGIRHIALTIEQADFEKMVAKLKSEPVEVVTDVTVSSSGIKTFFFHDPEGNILHLIFRPKPLG